MFAFLSFKRIDRRLHTKIAELSSNVRWGGRIEPDARLGI
jgi:hypothetical protein